MSPKAEDAFQLVGSVVADRYSVERVVARGGFGLVYKAAHLELSVPVALKVLVHPEAMRGGAGAALVERFRQEARTLAALKHPAIVRVLDVGTVDPVAGAGPHLWMALEWLDGATLEEDLRARGSLGRSPREALSLLAPVLEAMASAHEQGIAHRDLKPTNLMTSAGAQKSRDLRVLDFGIAKLMAPDERPGSGETETRSDESAFSLQHAAPEQVGRARTGPWTDVHALGLLVTEMLAGRRAYEGADSFTLYAAIMSPDRPTPARLGVDAGPWEPVLRKALALRPGDRFANAGELLAALSEHVAGATVAWERRAAGAAVRATPEAASPSRARAYALGLAALLGATLMLLAGARGAGDRPAPVARQVA
ncbi:MAG: Serine/threonine protein kinase, partial [Myxococcaceae bacterium]|nr:Serine/threonine protein kinase [Myxococcaceae bacterium]